MLFVNLAFIRLDMFGRQTVLTPGRKLCVWSKVSFRKKSCYSMLLRSRQVWLSTRYLNLTSLRHSEPSFGALVEEQLGILKREKNPHRKLNNVGYYGRK